MTCLQGWMWRRLSAKNRDSLQTAQYCYAEYSVTLRTSEITRASTTCRSNLTVFPILSVSSSERMSAGSSFCRQYGNRWKSLRQSPPRLRREPLSKKGLFILQPVIFSIRGRCIPNPGPLSRAPSRSSPGKPPGPPRPPWAWRCRWTPGGRPRSCGPSGCRNPPPCRRRPPRRPAPCWG